MRFTTRSNRKRLLATDITPMIDVVFLLIIFFLTTAQFARMTHADVDLPKQQGEQEQEREKVGIVINLTNDGRIIVSDQEYDLDGLRELIGNESRRHGGGQIDPVRVLLRADRNSPARLLNRVVSMLRDLGVGLARIATETI